jgi:glutamate synthase domain-containing protein 2
MSYGSLSKNAIMALNKGAKLGGFAHNTGEGGLSPYHQEYGADIIWQIGTGYFGCRNESGGFDADKFKQTANLPMVKMIEIKLSQGAKPGHGGILPAAKVTEEIAKIRHVPMSADTVNAARAMMFALGCVQSRSCNTDKCPTGIATQDPARYKALYIELKGQRVANYHKAMIENLLELLAAAGLESLEDLKPSHIQQRVGGTVCKNYDELYPSLPEGCLLQESTVPGDWKSAWNNADAYRW